ncbi:MAG: hypothetical protein M3323_00605 [Actinomycetota bacterium]|nr:hypothetical protein [Actinomycetota bacterium]
MSLAVLLRTSVPFNLSSVNRLAAAFLAPAALIAALEFWHQTSYLPAKLEATITVEPSLHFERTRRPVSNQGTAEVLLRNEGDVATFIIISGLLVCPREGPAELKGATVGDKGCIQGTRPFAARSFLEAESFVTHRQVFSWKDDATVVESLARVAYARADRLRLGRQISGRIECRSSTGAKSRSKIGEAYPILPASRYQSLVRVNKILAYSPESERGGRTYWITDANDPRCERDDALLDQFGIREIAIASQEWILRKPAPRAVR